MNIELRTDLQHHIAQLLWDAESTEKVKDIIKVYGKEAEVVFHMVMATYFDGIDDVDLANEVLENLK